MVEVRQHHIVAPGRQLVVEDDRADRAGVRVREPLAAARPAAAERRQPVGIDGGRRAGAIPTDQPDGEQRRLARERQRHVDHLVYVLRRQVQILAALLQPLVQLPDAPADLVLDLEQLALRRRGVLGRRGVQVGTVAQHRALHLRGQHRPHAAQVFADLLDLLRRPPEELQVALQAAGVAAEGRNAGVVARADEVEYLHLAGPLAVPVDAAVALLHAVGVPGDLVVDQPRAVVLQVDALGCGVGGQQDTHRRLLRVCLEGRLDRLPLVDVHAAEQGQQHPLARGPARAGGARRGCPSIAPLSGSGRSGRGLDGGVGGQQLQQPALGVPVFGEDQRPVPAPAAIGGAQRLAEPPDQHGRLAVGPPPRALRPAPKLIKELLFRRAGRAEQQRGGLQRLVRGVVVARVVLVLLLARLDLPAQQAHAGQRCPRASAAGGGQRGQVAFQGDREGLGRGEQPLLEHLERELGGEAFALVLRALQPQAAVLLQPGVGLALLSGIGHGERRHQAPGEGRRAGKLVDRQLRFQPPDHHRAQLGPVGRGAAREALVVEQLQQGLEALRVAVVRGGREEQPVLAVGGQGADGLGAQRVGGVLALPGGCHVVRLVHDQQVDLARVADLAAQHLAQQAHRPLALEVVDGGDQPREVPPRVDVQAPGAAQLAHQLAVHDPELQAELVAHLLAPLDLDRRGADDQHGARPVAQQQLVGHQPGLDRLAQAHVVGDQQVDAGHADGAGHRIELIGLDLDAAAEGRLQRAGVRRGDRAPAHRVQEGIEACRVVEAGLGRGQLHRLMHPRPRLHLPDHPQRLLAQRVILHR